MTASRTRLLVLALLTAALAAAPAAEARRDAKSVLYVGNNWAGTADVIHPTKFKRLARLNIIPDIRERMAEIQSNPDQYAFFLLIRREVGEGHDQFVDDMFSSHDGRYLYVSRPSLADVVAFDLRTQKIKWRQPVDGYRSDHMAISPDGRRLLVSASTGNVVHEIDTRTGKRTGVFESGDSPHENNYSEDGRTVYHASIGRVYTPTDDPILNPTKGKEFFQVVDARTLAIKKRIDMDTELAAFGRPDMSGAVRPMAVAPGEKRVYFQVSFFHGFVEYDLVRDRVVRLANLPITNQTPADERDYLLDSAHHGLAMNPKGTKLCAAGTMSNYAAIVHRRDFRYRIIPGIDKPYWSTNSASGKLCFISASGADEVHVVSYKTEKRIAKFPVGDHPQRMRMGHVRYGLLGIKRPRKRFRATGQRRVRSTHGSRRR